MSKETIELQLELIGARLELIDTKINGLTNLLTAMAKVQFNIDDVDLLLTELECDNQEGK